MWMLKRWSAKWKLSIKIQAQITEEEAREKQEQATANPGRLRRGHTGDHWPGGARDREESEIGGVGYLGSLSGGIRG